MDHDAEGLTLFETDTVGRGVRTTRRFARGDLVLTFRGPLLQPGEIEDFTHTIQVGVEIFAGPSGGLDDYVNHSCEPSCGLRSRPPALELVALRDIAPGEEITFDYSTCLVLEPEMPVCRCGSPVCRGRVLPFWQLDPRTRRACLRRDTVPEFVLRSRPKPVPLAPRARASRRA